MSKTFKDRKDYLEGKPVKRRKKPGKDKQLSRKEQLEKEQRTLDMMINGGYGL